MDSDRGPGERGALAFFASWLLLHEQADDWLRDALRRARETPEDLRREYQDFLLAVDREKEMLKGLVGEVFTNEVRRRGFLHREEGDALRAEMEDLRARMRGLEEKLERIARRG